MPIRWPIASISRADSGGVLPPSKILTSDGLISCRAAAASSSADCGASTKPTSAPASKYAFTRSIDDCNPSTARASERAMMTMSGVRGVTVMDQGKIVGPGGHGKYLWRRIGQPPILGKLG
ncbi:MAG: hypothetical protein ABI654_08005 [Betaproteobacteria bacterium]